MRGRPGYAVKTERGDGAEHVVHQIFLRVEKVAVADLEHSFFRTHGDGAGEFDQLVNATDAENDEDCSDPDFPAAQTEIVSKAARDRHAACDAKEIMHVAVEFDAVPGTAIKSERAKVMKQQCHCEQGVMAGMQREFA